MSELDEEERDSLWSSWRKLSRLKIFRSLEGDGLSTLMITGLMLLASVLLTIVLSIHDSARRLQNEVVGRYSVEIPANLEGNDVIYRFQSGAYRIDQRGLRNEMALLQRRLRNIDGVQSIRWIDPAEINVLLRPLLGAGITIDQAGFPLLIDVETTGGSDSMVLERLVGEVGRTAPGGMVDDHGRWKETILQRVTLVGQTATGIGILIFVVVVLISSNMVQMELLLRRHSVRVLVALGAPLSMVRLLVLRKFLAVASMSLMLTMLMLCTLVSVLLAGFGDTVRLLFGEHRLGLSDITWLMILGQNLFIVLIVSIVATRVTRRFLDGGL